MLTNTHAGVFIPISNFHNDNMVCYLKSGYAHYQLVLRRYKRHEVQTRSVFLETTRDIVILI
jgi:hypothetical protein